MGMLDDKLVETATKIVVKVNEYGDDVWGATSSRPCLYRDISTLQQNANRQEVTIDGLIWFKAEESVERGDIYLHADEGYLRIERVIPAKRLLADNSLQFHKCEVIKVRQIS